MTQEPVNPAKGHGRRPYEIDRAEKLMMNSPDSPQRDKNTYYNSTTEVRGSKTPWV